MSNLYKFNQDTQIDEFGVNHSNFSLRDEIEYNTMRANQSMPKQQNPVRQVVGDTKEGFDYLKNRFYKGFSYPDALSDYLHDKDVNLQGRQLSKNPLYSNSIEACQYQRVKDINEKY